jgi:hypothetical protein
MKIEVNEKEVKEGFKTFYAVAKEAMKFTMLVAGAFSAPWVYVFIKGQAYLTLVSLSMLGVPFP